MHTHVQCGCYTCLIHISYILYKKCHSVNKKLLSGLADFGQGVGLGESVKLKKKNSDENIFLDNVE